MTEENWAGLKMPEASVNSPRFETDGDRRVSCRETASRARVFLRKTTLVDYPGKVASALFFSGCGLRCPWCQNRELVLFSDDRNTAVNSAVMPGAPVPLKEALSHLEKRRAVLGGIVLSGGEPTGFAELQAFIETVKNLGLPVKLDTNGMNPGALETLFSGVQSRPDYIALDLKLPPERYAELLPRANSGFKAGGALARSALLVRESGIAHEYRTLALPGDYLRAEELDALAPLVDDSPWYFRTFVPGNCLDPAWNSFSAPDMEKAALLAEKARSLGKRGICP